MHSSTFRGGILTACFIFSIGSETLVWCDVIMRILSVGNSSAVSVCPRPDSEEEWIFTFYGMIFTHMKGKWWQLFFFMTFLTFWNWNDALYSVFKRKPWASTPKQLILVWIWIQNYLESERTRRFRSSTTYRRYVRHLKVILKRKFNKVWRIFRHVLSYQGICFNYWLNIILLLVSGLTIFMAGLGG